MTQDAVRNDANRYLTLTLGSESFAIRIDAVREILDYTEITRIPQTPPFMRGVVNVRGAAVPVVDLAYKLGLGDVQRTIHTRIVILEVIRDGVAVVMWMTPISGALRSWRVMRSTSSRRASSFFRSEMSRNTA